MKFCGKKIKFVTVTVIAALLLPMSVVCANAYSSTPLVVDDAGVLTESEYSDVLEAAEKVSDSLNFDFVIVTTDDTDGKTSMEYADDFYDNSGYRDDGALFLVDFENRNMWISTNGNGIIWLDEYCQDSLYNLVEDDIKNGKYETAFISYLEYAEHCVSEARENQTEPDYGEKSLLNPEYVKHTVDFKVCIFASVIVGIIVALVVTGKYKKELKSVKLNKNATGYIKQDSMNITSSRDMFLYSNVSKTRRADDDDNHHSGGGHTHTSSSGRTHGGSGRSF